MEPKQEKREILRFESSEKLIL